jgi:hypothetical protein
MFTPALLTKAPDASHPTLCSSLCPNAKLHCQADGTCLCPSGQLCYNPPPSTLPPPLYTDPAGNTCPPSAVDGSGYCPQLSSGTQHPYTDPNGVTCYPDQLDGYGYCPGSLQPATDGGGYTTQPVPVSPQPIFVPQPPVSPQPMYTTPSAPSPDDGSQYASSQVPAPGMLVPVSTASPYAWSQLSTMAKIAVVLLGVGVVGGGYYMIKRRRRAAA